MNILKLLKKNREAEPKTFKEVYSNEVEKRIREKYSLSAELAILRQRDAKPEEFNAYNEYAERCKAEFKAELENA